MLPSFLAFVFPLLLLFTLAPSAAAKDIVVGQSVDLSGPLGYLGRDYVAGAKVYFDYVNNQGGIDGRKIQLITRDNAGSAEKSAEISKEFLGRQKVDVLFGYFGEGSVASLLKLPAFDAAHVPLVAPLSGQHLETAAGNVFYVRPEYSVEAKKLVAYFLQHGVKRFAVVFADDEYGRTVKAAVEAELKARQGELLGSYPVGASGEGMDQAVGACRDKKPQATILALQTLPAAQFIKAYRKNNIGAFVMGLSLVNPQTVYEFAGSESATGVMLAEVVPHPNDPLIPVAAEHSRLLKKYRDEPASHLTLEGFIAAKLLVTAMRSAGRNFTAEQLSSVLASQHDLDMGGFFVSFGGKQRRGSSYVDINVIDRTGKLRN